MTIQEVVAALQAEKQANVPSRFPCRAIMVKNISGYCDLLSELKKISDIHLVDTMELFSGADVMPKYENLKDSSYKDKWVILTGVGEYLRLFAKSEMNDRRFASLWGYQAPEDSTGRIIIPLWGCEAQWFDKSLHLMADLRQQDFYYDCTNVDDEVQQMKLLILSGDFEGYISKLESMKGNLKIGLQDWFEYWSDPVPKKTEFVLLTRRYRSVSTVNDKISVHVISDTLSMIQESMKGASALTKDNCSDEMQKILFDYALKGKSLDASLLSILNVSSFSGQDIMGKWKTLDESHRMFVKLWFNLHPDNTYLCHCFSITTNLKNIPDVIMLEIFKNWSDKPNWVQEYRLLMNIMGLSPDKRVFKELDTIPIYEQRLDFIVGNSIEARTYILNMFGNWMRVNSSQALSSEKLKKLYPELSAYLDDEKISLDDEIKHYMAKYKSYKLKNTLPEDEETYFNGIQTDIYDTRYSILSEYFDSDTIVLWIDALGIEWLPLLRWSLLSNCDASIKAVSIGQARLPTETIFNDNEWKKTTIPHDKLDKLDKLAHKGVIDDDNYYSCVQEQLTFVANIYQKVNELMQQYHRIIITGDHGTSRLAARLFHNRDGMPVPNGGTVFSHGRYCLIDDQSKPSVPNTRIVKAADGNHYVVYENYDHFKISGFAAGADDDNAVYGEVHGGATPEELLVPVIVLDSNRDIPLLGEWEKDTVKISMKKVKLQINFNKPVNQLQVRIAGIDGETVCASDKKIWNIMFRGIGKGTYSVQVYANNKIVTMPDITIKPALGGGEGDLPI